MVSPTTVSFSILTLVLGDRPLRTGFLFYLGALTATLGIGVLAAFVIGDVAASSTPSSPKTWVAIIDVGAGLLLLTWVIGRLRRPPDPTRQAKMIDQMSKVASSPAIAIIGAGAALANPGAFIPLALKAISETNPGAAQYFVEWVFFALVSLLPLSVALLLLVFTPDHAERILDGARTWLERHARTVAGVLVIALAAALLRNRISGLLGCSRPAPGPRDQKFAEPVAVSTTSEQCIRLPPSSSPGGFGLVPLRARRDAHAAPRRGDRQPRVSRYLRGSGRTAPSMSAICGNSRSGGRCVGLPTQDPFRSHDASS